VVALSGRKAGSTCCLDAVPELGYDPISLPSGLVQVMCLQTLDQPPLAHEALERARHRDHAEPGPMAAFEVEGIGLG
jgi:hypothetical protein